MKLEPDVIYERLTFLGDEWAELNYAAELLEETRKSVMAELANQSGESSATAKESFALRHGDYKEFVTKMVKARYNANKAKVKYDSAKVWVDLLRTQNANERAANRSAV